MRDATAAELAATELREAAAQALSKLQAEREELFSEPAEKQPRASEGATAGTAADHAVDDNAPPRHGSQ